MSLEFVLFLNCICIGIIVAGFSSCTYILKRLFKFNLFIVIALDFLAYFTGGFLIFIMACKMINVKFYIFTLLGFLVGIILEKSSVSGVIKSIEEFIFNKLRSLKSKKIKLVKYITK